MKVLVTGHLGYIGTVLTPLLLARGHEVHGLDSDLFGACTFTGDIADIPCWKLDVRDFVVSPDAVEKLRGFDAVIHLAGLSNDPLGDYRPELTQTINAEASIRMAKLAKSAGVPRFVFASSCSNYGASSDNFIAENGTFNPVTPYGASKVEVELAVREFADEDFSPTFLRASTAYGVSPRLRFDLVVNNLTAWAYTTGEVYLKSDGSPWRPIVHVEDIARAYIATIEAPREDVHLEAFNVGQTTENYQIREIAEIVRDVVPGSKVGFATDAGPDKRNYRVDCNHIARKLHGFKPQWTCRRGVEQLLDAYRATRVTLEEFEGERFKRIAHIKRRIAEGSLTGELKAVDQFETA
ncbi:MAG: NAD(P)-dependent oxidoreductase [Henriciella sp.]|uniref:NAD-dependent epimerase/dehydratase family protein n=1 Tax=Henriciella sp. TaxID=1968823 RepID=UPI0026052440|nr:NAD(P)-dependent oxidoreductase [Henriciella sp.]